MLTVFLYIPFIRVFALLLWSEEGIYSHVFAFSTQFSYEVLQVTRYIHLLRLFLLFVYKKSPSEKVKNLFTWMSTAHLWWLKVHHWWREVHRWWRKVNPWWRKVHSWWRKVHFLAFCGVKYMVAECSIVYEWINIRRVDAEEERES